MIWEREKVRWSLALVVLAAILISTPAEAAGRRRGESRRGNYSSATAPAARQAVAQPATTAPLKKAADAPKVEPNAVEQPEPDQPKVVAKKPLNPRVVFITAKDSRRSTYELARLDRRGGEFDKMRARGWTIGAGPENNVQIVDREAIPELVEKLGVADFPTVACIDNGEIVRSFRSGCTTPLDRWTIGFLATGNDERPPGTVLEAAYAESTGHYPLRGNHWSVDGDWNPTREEVITHLRGPNHAGQLLASWQIEQWSLEELRAVHDDLHEKYDSGNHSPQRKSHVDSYLRGRPRI